MKNCSKCNKPIQEEYPFCPWCGTALSEPKQAEAPESNAVMPQPGLRFTPEQLSILRKRIGEVYLNPARFTFSEDGIFWARYTDGWGRHCANPTETEKLTIRPVDLSESIPEDLQPGFTEKNVGFVQIFRHLADSARGDAEPLVWSAARDGFYREDGSRSVYVIASHTMAVRDPMGIGVDILVTYEAYG